MTNRVKTGLFFGCFMACVYIVNGLWHIDKMSNKEILLTVSGGLIGGAVAGFLFGYFIRFPQKNS